MVLRDRKSLDNKGPATPSPPSPGPVNRWSGMVSRSIDKLSGSNRNEITITDFHSLDSEEQEKMGNMGYPVFKESYGKDNKKEGQRGKIENIPQEGVQNTHPHHRLEIGKFAIEFNGSEYLLYKDEELIGKSERITELVASYQELYEHYYGNKEFRDQVIETFIQDPQLFNKLVRFFDKYIAEDYKTRKYILLTAFSAFTDSPLNLAVKAPTSEGKTHNVTTITKFFPKKSVIKLGSASPTAFIHDSGATLVDDDLRSIEPQLEQIEEEMRTANNEGKKELAKERRELLRNAKYLVDLSKKIVVFLEEPHPELWKKLRPILSHDSPEVEYRITDKSSSGLRAKTVVVRGYPAVIYCTTRVEDISIEDELKSRFLSVTTDQTKEKYERALEIIARSAYTSLSDSLEDNLIKDVIERLTRVVEFYSKYIEPIGLLSICNSVFSYNYKSGVVLRKFKEFVSLLKIHTAIHGKSRPILQIEGSSIYLPILEDYEKVLEIISDSNLNVEPHVMEFFKSIEEFINEREFFTLEDLMEWLRERGRIYSGEYVRKVLRACVYAGFLSVEKDPEDRRRNLYTARYVPNHAYQATKEIYNKIDFEKELQEVIKRYLKVIKDSNNQKYLQLSLKYGINGFEQNWSFSSENECVGVLVEYLRMVFFRNRINGIFKENKPIEKKRKEDILYFPDSQQESSEKSENLEDHLKTKSESKQDFGDGNHSSWSLDNIIDIDISKIKVIERKPEHNEDTFFDVLIDPG